MNMLPIFLKLKGRRCLLVGAGNVAQDKIGSLLKTGLSLRVVAPEALPEVRRLAAEGKLEWIERRFEALDLDGNFLVIAATDSPEVNAAIYRGAVERGILCNSVDDIPHCDFFFGSVVSRGALQIAISTSGESPAVAQRLRREIDEQLPEDLGAWLANLGQLRREVLAFHPPGEARKALLHQLAELPVCASEDCPSRRLAFAPREEEPTDGDDAAVCHGDEEPESQLPAAHEPARAAAEMVSLVGAGPGDPDLLTVKAVRLIQTADVVLHDDLVPQAILDIASPCAEIVNVGKRCGVKTITQEAINALMIERARADRSVVRLKSGDPLLFSRAAEEMAALAAAGIPFQIVSGVTAAFAAAAAAGCSLTSRTSASKVIFSTGHHAQSHNDSPLSEQQDATRVVYMPGRDLHLLAEEWLQQGLPAELPCAVVSHAAQPDQRVRYCTLAHLGDTAPTLAPSLLIAGWAVGEIAGAEQLAADGELESSVVACPR
jgi:uroporphyrin-III C-methyltransferase/precorrin-2 dehydrogenase/sirohydrochlorin ferrochelatase